MPEGAVQVDYFGVIINKAKLIAAAALVCGLVAVAGYFILPKTYESGLVLEVGIVSLDTQSEQGIATEPIEPVEVVRDVITSKPFLASVINKLGLGTIPEILAKKVKAKINEDIRGREINRQIIVSAKASSPEAAKQLADGVADLLIERHRSLFEQALENRYAYEKILDNQIQSLRQEIDGMRKTLARVYESGSTNTASLVLLQANIHEKQVQVTDLRRELSQAELLDKTNLKSSNTRVTIPSYLPQEPNYTWKVSAAAGLVVGFFLACCALVLAESVRMRRS